jgi:hypothetical protein
VNQSGREVGGACGAVIPSVNSPKTSRYGIYVQFSRFRMLHSVLLRADRVIE